MTKKAKVNWMRFGKKVWSKGLSSALREEVVPVTSNNLDNIAVEALDKVVEILLPEKETKEITE